LDKDGDERDFVWRVDGTGIVNMSRNRSNNQPSQEQELGALLRVIREPKHCVESLSFHIHGHNETAP
jgi:hypothetical protein